MIHFSCSCGMKFKVKDEFAGRRSKCPTCKQTLTVPQPDRTQAYVPVGQIDGTVSSVAQAGVDGGVTLDQGSVPSGQKPVRDLLAGKAKAGGRYIIEKEIARGGMGAVLRAVDCDIRREVAVKFMLDDKDPKKKARFVEEAQITGQLEHPNIVPIHELGVDKNKRMFFSMKMVKGRSLKEVVDHLRDNPRQADKEWPLSRLLTILVNVCNALAYSHSRGVVHRDLKPANIMVGDFGEVYVMDWGLAKVLDLTAAAAPQSPGDIEAQRFAGFMQSKSPGPLPSDSGVASSSGQSKVSTSGRDDADLTQEGSVLGTPVYMPPEQAMGEIGAIDRRSDVYSLGAILYEMLTLAPPIEKDGGYMAILLRVSQGEIVPPEKRGNRNIPKELSAIAMKALARNRQDRYQNVELLRKDIERYQEGRSVSAKEDTKTEMLWKFVKRNKGFSAGATMTLAVLVFGLFFLMKANAELKSERKARQDQGKAAVPSFVRAGKMLVNEGRFKDALAQADVALDFDPKDVDATLLRGHVLIGQLRYAEAHDVLAAYLKLKPDDSGATALMNRSKINSDNSTELLGLADELNRQKLFALGDEVTRQATTLVKSRNDLLATYQKRVDSAWPGLGQRLETLPDGFLLSLGDCGKQVTDLTPLKGMPLTELELHRCTKVRDLAPLQGMGLRRLSLDASLVQDLSPLQDMPLTILSLGFCNQVQDLSPLRGTPLKILSLTHCGQVKDLSPLQGLPLTSLDLSNCGVTDVSPLAGMKLSELVLPYRVEKGTSVLRRMTTLTKINNLPAAEFWMQYEAGKFPLFKP